MIGQRLLAAVIALVHGAELRDGDMALIGEDERVFGNVFEECGRRLARLATGQIAGIILDAGTGAGGAEHFQVEFGALLQALGFQQLAFLLHPGEAFLELGLDLDHGLVERRARRDIVGIGVEFDRFQLGHGLAGERVEFGDLLDLVAEKPDPPGAVVVVGREDFQIIAANAEGAADEGGVIAGVLQVDELAHDGARIGDVAGLQLEGHRRIGLDRADAVNARDRGDDDHVIAFEDGARRGVAHPVDRLIDRRFFLDVGVGARHIGFGHVVVVIGDEILDRIVREEALELAIELGGEGLVRRQDQGRALHRLDDLGHGEGLAGAGRAEQDLVALLALETLDQFGNRLRLVTLGGVFRDALEALPALGLFRPVGAMRRPLIRRRHAGQRVEHEVFRGGEGVVEGQLGHGGNM